MNLKTLGTIEILAGSFLALLTLITPGEARTELYVIAAALFVAGHVLVAAAWRQSGAVRHREDAPGPREAVERVAL